MGASSRQARQGLAHPLDLLALLAHQGGWDEVLLVAVPIVVIVILLAIAKHRVEAQLAADARPRSQPDPRPDVQPDVQPGSERD